MATTKKVIGRVPTYRGQYKEDTLYHILNIVTYLGSAFTSTMDNNRNIPCIILNDLFVLQEGWLFFVDNSNAYFLKYREVDLPQDEFDRLKEQNLLDVNKNYYTYENDNLTE